MCSGVSEGDGVTEKLGNCRKPSKGKAINEPKRPAPKVQCLLKPLADAPNGDKADGKSLKKRGLRVERGSEYNEFHKPERADLSTGMKGPLFASGANHRKAWGGEKGVQAEFKTGEIGGAKDKKSV